MFIGFDSFGYGQGMYLNTRICISSYNKIEIGNFIVDALLVREDITKDFKTEKNLDWDVDTLLNVHFQGDLEAGNISTMGKYIEKILVQKREIDSLIWEDVVEFDYEDKIQYKILDHYVQNGFEYEYAMIPKSQNVIGNRRLSPSTVVQFEGNFLTDSLNNYHFKYDIEDGDITNNVNQSTFESIDARYPIIVYGELDYKSGSMTALFYTGVDGTIDIKKEKVAKDKIMAFVKNKKPKVFRKENGELLIINIVGSPQEISHPIMGVSKLKFDFVEVAEFNKENLTAYNLIEKGVGYND